MEVDMELEWSWMPAVLIVDAGEDPGKEDCPGSLPAGTKKLCEYILKNLRYEFDINVSYYPIV